MVPDVEVTNIRNEFTSGETYDGGKKHLHQEMGNEYFKIKILSFIMNLDETKPFVMDKSKSKKVLQYQKILPF